MNRLRWLVIAVIILSVAPVRVVWAQSREALVNQLKAALRTDDRAAVVALINFPVTVSIAGLRMPLADSAMLLARYGDIFTAEMRSAIDHRDADVLVVGPVEGRLMITAMTVPEAEAGGASSGSTSAARESGPREPRRVSVRAGPRPTQFAGALVTATTDVYLVFVPKGQLLEVRLERVGRAAVARVTHVGTGAPLNARMPGGGLVVSGRSAIGGDYRIDVDRTAGDSSPHLPYLLSVSLR